MKTYIFFALALSLSTLSIGQNPNILWQNTIGGSDDDYLNCINNTTDGGYIIGGNSESNISGDKLENCHGERDYWIVKVNALGEIEWQNTIGGDGDDYLNFVKQTIDGNYIVGGSSFSNISGDKTEPSRGANDYWILKLDNIGNILWQRTIGGLSEDYLSDIIETPDGGFLLGGHSRSDISGEKTENSKGGYDYWVLKLNNIGNIEWQRTIGGNFRDTLRSLYITDDNGFVLAGSSRSELSGDKTEPSNGGDDLWIIKLDNTGAIIWQNTIGGSDGDYPWKIKQSNDGGYIIASESFSNKSGDKSENNYGASDFWVVKINSSGVIEWENTIGGFLADGCFDLICDFNGNYVIVGYSDSNLSGDKTDPSNGSTDIWLLTLNNSGEIIEQYSIGGSGPDYAFTILRTNDNKVLLGGTSWSDISGDKTENSMGGFDYWILLLDNLLSVSKNEYTENLSIFPSPANNFLEVYFINNTIDRYKIYSQMGSLIQEGNFQERNARINISKLASGIYYVQIISGNNKFTKKFIKK